MQIEPIIFKAAQAVVIVLYVAIGSDFAHRQGTKPLIHPTLSAAMRWTYLALVGVYLYILYRMDSVLTSDLVALAFSVAGTLVYIRAKRDLAQRFTYVGYAYENVTVMREGIYAYIRHPIYTGSYLFTIGALFTAIPRITIVPWPLAAFGAIGVLYIYAFFIPLLASRESRNMREQHGSEFEQYQRSVHAFIPSFRR